MRNQVTVRRSSQAVPRRRAAATWRTDRARGPHGPHGGCGLFLPADPATGPAAREPGREDEGTDWLDAVAGSVAAVAIATVPPMLMLGGLVVGLATTFPPRPGGAHGDGGIAPTGWGPRGELDAARAGGTALARAWGRPTPEIWTEEEGIAAP